MSSRDVCRLKSNLAMGGERGEPEECTSHLSKKLFPPRTGRCQNCTSSSEQHVMRAALEETESSNEVVVVVSQLVQRRQMRWSYAGGGSDGGASFAMSGLRI